MQTFMFLSAFIVSKSGLTGQIRGGVPDLWLCLMREPLFLGNRHHFNEIRLPATHMLYRLSIALCCVKLDVFTPKTAQPGEQVLADGKGSCLPGGLCGADWRGEGLGRTFGSKTGPGTPRTVLLRTEVSWRPLVFPPWSPSATHPWHLPRQLSLRLISFISFQT